MKYMGSKKFMLNNGLGQLIREQLPYANRVIDPFCGAGSVVYYVAQNSNKQIIAGDLQKYAVVLANAVIGRTRKLDTTALEKKWLIRTQKKIEKSKLFSRAIKLDKNHSRNIGLWVKRSRELCKTKSTIGPVWNAYGGYYFSPKQALTFDYLLDTLPSDQKLRDVCLAAVITAATRCVASPGHTAQPFQPTKTAKKFIKIAWDLDPIKSCATIIKEIAPLHAKIKGRALVADAKELASRLKKGDLVIVDPPYSGVQYSRFYHVLETIARGRCGPVSGVGRYPVLYERPQSAFSKVGQSLKALEDLVSKLAHKEATVIFTFPKGKCSNGLSGDIVIEVVKKWFDISPSSRIHEHAVLGNFSTMGGNNKLKLKNNRVKTSRVKSEELLLLLKPKAKSSMMKTYRS
jgi:adenine-specific DNA-methyltransferase